MQHAKLSVALSYFAAALTLCLTACPAQSACPPCFIGGVQAPDGRPNPSPNATINLQLGTSVARQGKVSQVTLTLTDASGNTETVTYGADKVGTLSSSSMLTIEDNEVYNVRDQAVDSARVDIVFVNGHRASDEIDIQTE